MFLQLEFFDDIFAESSHHEQVDFRLGKTRKQFAEGFCLVFYVSFDVFVTLLSFKAIIHLLGVHIIEVFDKLILAILPTLFFIFDLKVQKPKIN